MQATDVTTPAGSLVEGGKERSAAETRDLFVRRSSGLTRAIGSRDALIFASVGPGFLVTLVFIMWTSWLYPGMYYPAAVLSVFFMMPISLLYWFFSTAMPRSGGEYVYVSRTLHPSIGLMCSWVIILSIAGASGMVTMWCMQYCLGNGFYALAIAGHHWAAGVGDFFWSNWGKTLGLFIVYPTLTYILLRGTRWVVRCNWFSVAISIFAFALLAIAIFATGGHTTFIHNWNALSPQSYQHVLNFASAKGYLVPFAFVATLAGGLTYVCENSTGATFSANIAGEVRGVQKSQVVALVGSLLISMVVWWALSALVFHGVGAQFNSALSNILVNDPSAYPTVLKGKEPFIGLLLVFFTKNSFLLIGFAIAVALSLSTSLVPLAFACHRNVFAWSFDRILPEKFAELDSKYRQPWVVVLSFSTIVMLFGLAYIWTPQWLGFISFFIILWFIGWFFLGISGIIFPWRRPAIYNNAPPLVRSKFLGIPIISILGALTAGVSVTVEYFMFKPILAGAINVRAVITAGVLAVIPYIIFFVSKAYHAKRAVPLDMQFSEVPPE